MAFNAAEPLQLELCCPHCGTALTRATRHCHACGERLVCPFCAAFSAQRERPYDVRLVRRRCVTCHTDFGRPLATARAPPPYDHAAAVRAFVRAHRDLLDDPPAPAA